MKLICLNWPRSWLGEGAWTRRRPRSSRSDRRRSGGRQTCPRRDSPRNRSACSCRRWKAFLTYRRPNFLRISHVLELSIMNRKSRILWFIGAPILPAKAKKKTPLPVFQISQSQAHAIFIVSTSHYTTTSSRSQLSRYPFVHRLIYVVFLSMKTALFK